MLKVKVTVPAVCTGLGPGLSALGLALALQDTLEFGLRTDSQFVFSAQGEGDAPAGLRHPTMQAAIRLFQMFESAPAGLNVTITHRIPTHSGLGDQAALIAGGLVGANNLLDTPLKREALIALACEMTGEPTATVTTLLGGLTVSSGSGPDLLYKRLDSAPLMVVIAVPDLLSYHEQSAELAPVSISDAAFNLGRAALVIEALRKPDLDLLAQAMQDRVIEPHRKALIPGYDAVVKAALEAGALAVTLSGEGPALVAFASVNHKHIEQVMQQAFSEANVRARTWCVNVDTQGVSINLTR